MRNRRQLGVYFVVPRWYHGVVKQKPRSLIRGPGHDGQEEKPMTATPSIPNTTPRRETLKVESASTPGLFHEVDPARGFCSCRATVEVCRHVRIARVRLAKKATKRCRHCGGYGAFFWGATKHGDCPHCFGTGRAA